MDVYYSFVTLFPLLIILIIDDGIDDAEKSNVSKGVVGYRDLKGTKRQYSSQMSQIF